ncbi:putative ABC-type transport system, permease component [Vibrio nigripulchritudo MADA3029]|uniref:carbohydrate ABC transporter permease n=1 Tax=Vibrio nigripulchritudo TaxID=28173 RepID=UPI0003B19251|nr:carbohydrate ABC transporter permease [Vibrio nigripulchritudo]CCN45975.1 putative ABC-type transport system, permease component [Vibrio nigripulchritudo MADA3020]CCN54098.1 putative ABC-type transport system, permease component [Vibrio nigripulchritudo MADA3021]CCN61169.1 putative ABC-type transport system, permease component [Vibrio nigripulchritudo MADA3029]
MTERKTTVSSIIVRLFGSIWARRVVLYLFAIWCLFPLYWIFLTALKTPIQAMSRPPSFWFEATLKNFEKVLAEPAILDFFIDSAIVAAGSTILSLLIGAPTAYILARFHFKGRGDFGFWILSTRMTPPVAMLIPFFVLFFQLGLLDTHIGLIIAHVVLNLAIVVWLLRGFFSELPVELEEAAYLDGDTYFSAFFRITLPLALPGLASVGILIFLLSWNEFLFALVLGDSEVRTVPIGLYGFIGYQTIRWAELSASAALMIVPIIIFIVIFQRHLLRGLTMGSYR